MMGKAPGNAEGIKKKVVFFITERKSSFASSLDLKIKCREMAEGEKMHLPSNGVMLNAEAAKGLVLFILNEYKARTGNDLLDISGS